MKLELKHLAGYLPYGLKMYWEDNQNRTQKAWELKCDAVDFVLNNQNKPILHPLSDLTKEIKVNGEKFVPIDRLTNMARINYEMGLLTIDKDMTLKDYFKLLEWHFDIYGLIENGLAIDINTL